MLTKPALVTYFAAIAARAARAASHVCFSYPPSGTGGSTAPPPISPPPVIDPAIPNGTPIWLQPLGGDGYASVYPAPGGYTCTYRPTFVTTPGSYEPAVIYTVTCTQG